MDIEIKMVEGKAGTVQLLPLGKTSDGLPIYQPFPHTKVAVTHLMQAGFRVTCLVANGDTPLYGWVAPVQEEPEAPKKLDPFANIVFVKVDSDTVPDTQYTVAVDLDGPEALDCSCPAGQKKVPCKHLYRGKAIGTGAFREAAELLIKQGVVKGKAHFLEQFEKKVALVGKNEAIAAVIKKAFGETHILAKAPSKPKKKTGK